MKKPLFIFLLLALGSWSASGNDSLSVESTNMFAKKVGSSFVLPSSPWAYNINFHLSNFFRPGFSTGVERRVVSKVKTTTDSEGIKKSVYRQRAIELNVGYFKQSVVQDVALANVMYSLRKISNSRKLTSLGLGMGLQRSFLPETYRVNSNNQIEQVSLPGTFYGSVDGYVAYGKYKKGKNRAWQIKLGLSLVYGYNSSIIPNFNIEYGYKFGKRNNS